MTVDAKVSDNLDYCPNYSTSPLAKRYSECSDKEEDVQQLAQDYMLHECNRYCLKSTKARTPRTCRSHYGTKSEFGKLDTPGMDLIEKAQIQINRKGISHFRMRHIQSIWLNIANLSSKRGEQIVTSNRFCSIQIQATQTFVKLKMSVNMLWPILARDTTQVKKRKRRFKISSWGKFVIVDFFQKWKNFQRDFS
jgi:hypothetical protein